MSLVNMIRRIICKHRRKSVPDMAFFWSMRQKPFTTTCLDCGRKWKMTAGEIQDSYEPKKASPK